MAVVTAALLAACGSSAPATVTIHGNLTPGGAASGVFGSGMNATSYLQCNATNPSPGTQVVVTSPSGKVIGTGTLGQWSHAHQSVAGTVIYSCAMPFAVRGVPKEPRYGYRINGVPGVLWQSGTHVALDVNSSSG